MTQTYTKGSNPYFEYAMLKYSQISIINLMKKDNVLEHINELEFKEVSDVWELIHSHLQNVNLSLNAYNYSNYTLPTTEKPTDKFDFITKNSKTLGAYQSGVLVNDFSYFVDSNLVAKSKANEFSQRKYEMLHKVIAFTHLENNAELASVEARKAFFEAFLTILHKIHNADFEAKTNQINAELAPHIFVPQKYIRLENRSKVLHEVVGREQYIRWYDTQYYGKWYRRRSRKVPNYGWRDIIKTTTFNYQAEVEYETQFGKDKIPNEIPPAEPYKIQKLNGSWVTHDNQPLDTEGKSEDEILKM